MSTACDATLRPGAQLDAARRARTHATLTPVRRA
jgi:hypothetical protein